MKFPPIRVSPLYVHWYSYRWWKGAGTWLGFTTGGVLSFGFGLKAAVICAAGFVLALLWSVFSE